MVSGFRFQLSRRPKNGRSNRKKAWKLGSREAWSSISDCGFWILKEESIPYSMLSGVIAFQLPSYCASSDVNDQQRNKQI